MNDCKILLRDILNFNELKKQYPNKRIKLRFNTSWEDRNSKGEYLYRDYHRMYKSDDPEDKRFFKENIMSSTHRLFENDIVFQFIEIQYHIWLLIDAVNIIDVSGEHCGYNSFSDITFPIAIGERLECYLPFFDRLTVKWTNLPRQFFYVDEKIINSIEVNEIFSRDYLSLNEEFCGYENVSKNYTDLKKIINKPSWKSALSNVYGVYVITDLSNGKLYIGSATGDNGIYGRWSEYMNKGYDSNEANNNTYPNKQLKEIVKKYGIEYIKNNFQYSLLEIFPKSELGKDAALKRESYWKCVFASRTFGYNDN